MNTQVQASGLADNWWTVPVLILSALQNPLVEEVIMIGYLLMGLIFGLIHLRFKRVAPLVVAHTLLDIAAFVGYALVAPHVSWR